MVLQDTYPHLHYFFIFYLKIPSLSQYPRHRHFLLLYFRGCYIMIASMSETKKPLNRRKHDRYLIDDIPVEGIGSIVEVSRKGLKIRKAPGFTTKDRTLNFKISSAEIKTD